MFHWDAENVNVMNGIKMLKMFKSSMEIIKMLKILRSQVKN